MVIRRKPTTMIIDQPPLIEGVYDSYHTGHFFKGDEPRNRNVACFDTWWEAAGFLVSTMVEYADQEDDGLLAFNPTTMSYAEIYPEDCPLMTDTVQAVLRDDPPHELEDFAAEIADNDGRRVVFWLKRALCNRQVPHR
jgi:hypothetical protein